MLDYKPRSKVKQEHVCEKVDVVIASFLEDLCVLLHKPIFLPFLAPGWPKGWEVSEGKVDEGEAGVVFSPFVKGGLQQAY
jgi:hypothetical protein